MSDLDMFIYLKVQGEHYLQFTISNYGKLPLLDVQTIFEADFPNGRKVHIESARFHVIAPNTSKTTWFANNSKATIMHHSPQRLRYRTFDHPDQPITEEDAKPALHDQWVLRPGHDVEEQLGQSETQVY